MSGLTRKKIAVLELIRTCSEGVTSAEVMYSLGMSRSTVFFILDSLLKDNLIFRAHNETGRNSRRIYFPTAELAEKFSGKKIPMSKRESFFDSCRRHSKNYMITLLLRSTRQPPKEENQ
ncbi:helix-turn-helix domain-containing protein [Klebsiella pneumoniae]|uniref:helix-turn-helix domain-containing protein n=1 Tax=Klebsiella TaxID=570 RepID=UPI00029CB587|nr:helix-turn-helix domain-containing protein [Klebsiella pneumoniae]WCS67743.1 helix-turn-helix domain-containing protein [Stenotrophomonas phage vB_SmeS_BUCT708]WCS67749.1 helix-turn-helix domain-containing protein [Stenotrophomonas phage vB_SmeS_BUCT709]ARX37166.1 enterotoxin [Klebsiella pneumoniae]EIV2151697.1 helix-turn-helix domain-containing protein [Klebsiella pneumoniae]EIV6983497.1 helix-turn-helix domain-containing protein [Klebsiella pneumoniae]